MPDRRIEQAILIGTTCVAQSPGLDDGQVAAAERLVGRFGALAESQRCLFVQPLGRWIAVVQVSGRQFHVLCVPEKLYRIIHDPFVVAAECPADFAARNELPCIDWMRGPTPHRTLADVQAVLKTDESATLLGAAQALVDGGRVALRADAEGARLLRNLWLLLPTSVRAETRLATFVINTDLEFDLLATPDFTSAPFAGYLNQDQAGDYPEGRYELWLQLAADTNDADGIDRLLARRSMSQALRLAVTLLLTAIGLGLAMRFIPWERLR